MGEATRQHQAVPTSSSTSVGVTAITRDAAMSVQHADSPFQVADVGGTHARIG